MFEIKNDVPVPPHANAKFGITATLRKMEVGDSFQIPVGVTNKNRLSSAFARYATTKDGAGKRFSQRKMPDGFRVWRIG